MRTILKHAATILCLSVMALVLALVTVAWYTPARSNEPWHQPYGGCKEALAYPHSPGARECRAHGWTINRWFVEGPRGILRSTILPPCAYEDSTWCYWDAARRGNGEGQSFITIRREDRRRTYLLNGVHFGRWPR